MGQQGSKVDMKEMASETRMDQAHIEQLLKAFQKLANKKGLITKESIKQAIKQTYGEEDASFTNAIFNLFDKDGSKEIDAKEFILAVGYLTNKSLEDVVTTSFRCLDLNGDGQISRGEMRAVVLMNFKMKKWVNLHKKSIPLHKVPISPADNTQIIKDADDIFSRLDVNKDGNVSQEEFVKIANSDPILKQKLSELLIREEGLNLITTATSSKK